MSHEPDLAAVASLIGEPTRALILVALLGGEALPASELARRAHITPQTASSHLAKLLDGSLISVTTVGRHRYYRLKNADVARTLEALQGIAPVPQPIRPGTARLAPELCAARTCYDHLAGKLGVALTDALLNQGYLRTEEANYHLTPAGDDLCQAWGIEIEALAKKRRKQAYACLDWSERRYHIGGSLGAAIAEVFFAKHWIRRLPDTRALEVTHTGVDMLRRDFGISLPEQAR